MFITLLFALAAPCTGQNVPLPERPRDPWVFRSVLDGRPRMVTLALADAMWVSYDASTCSLYESWQGGVRFQGAVYTKEHGPQPVVEGTAYLHGIDGDVWECWQDEQRIAASFRWAGYWLHDQRCTLLYELILPDGRKFEVRETPEYVEPQLLFPEAQMQDWVLTAGDAGLLRSFYAPDLPKGMKLALHIRTDGARGKLVEAMERESDGPPRGGYVILSAEKPFNNAMLFFPPVLADTKLNPPAPVAHDKDK